MKDNKRIFKKIILKKEVISNMIDKQMKNIVGGKLTWNAYGYDTCMHSTQCPETYNECPDDPNTGTYFCQGGTGTKDMTCPNYCTVISYGGCNTLYPEC